MGNTHDERRDQLEEEVLRVVVGRVQREQDDLGDELNRRGLDEDAEDGHQVALPVGAVAGGALVRLPDPECHQSGGQTGLDDRDSVECGNPVEEPRVEDTGVRALRRVQAAY